jgi:asparagine N-glycosylation enzyme membrane subunit Stt3
VRFIRKLHLYLSVFFAPLLIFFVATGWYQTVSSQRNKVLGEQDTWVSKLTSVHVDQIYPTETGTGEYKPTLFRILVVTMSIALLLTVVLGIFLAFRSPSRAWLVALSFLVGILLPAAFLWLGQPK